MLCQLKSDIRYTIIGIVKGDNPETKKSRPVPAGGRKEASQMRFFHGTWYYQGQAYQSLRDALMSAWSR